MEIWATVATGVVAALATLSGVWLTQRHTERLAKTARTDTHRDVVRELLTRLVRHANQWADLTEVYLPGLAKFEMEDLTEFQDTDSGKQMREVNTALRSDFGEATLRVGDMMLLLPLAEAYRLHREASEKALGPLLPGKSRPTGDALFEQLLESLRHVYVFRRAVVELERAAAPLLQTPIASEEDRRT